MTIIPVHIPESDAPSREATPFVEDTRHRSAEMLTERSWKRYRRICRYRLLSYVGQGKAAIATCSNLVLEGNSFAG